MINKNIILEKVLDNITDATDLVDSKDPVSTKEFYDYVCGITDSANQLLEVEKEIKKEKKNEDSF